MDQLTPLACVVKCSPLRRTAEGQNELRCRIGWGMDKPLATASAHSTARPNPLLTCEEAARRIGIKVSTLYRYCRERSFPHIRLTARCDRVREGDIEQWLSRNAR